MREGEWLGSDILLKGHGLLMIQKCKVMCIMHGEEIKKSWVSAGDST
jgi:hypothetical protein